MEVKNLRSVSCELLSKLYLVLGFTGVVIVQEGANKL